MAKFSPLSRLPKQEQERIIKQLAESLATLKDPKDVLFVLEDLLSEKELGLVAKRIKIASYLVNKASYETISKAIKVTPTTIARISNQLKKSGRGYRILLKDE